MIKTCNKCQRELSINEFSLNSSKKDGHNSVCKSCQKAYSKNHYKSKKTYYTEKSLRNKKKQYQENLFKVSEYKTQHSCKYCGESDHCCLDLHHRKPSEKSYSIANKLGEFSWSSLMEEIVKCDVVCSNCHRKLHAGQVLVSRAGFELAKPTF